ncbi:hypothetical protein HOD29_05145 [archaeon]|jgi:hypothetical protein|nr:hypothetical protein [archaeon]
MKQKKAFWLRKRILAHIKLTENKKFTVKRNFSDRKIILDFFGGSCSSYTYDGKWIGG